jgi:hypothetical protein
MTSTAWRAARAMAMADILTSRSRTHFSVDPVIPWANPSCRPHNRRGRKSIGPMSRLWRSGNCSGGRRIEFRKYRVRAHRSIGSSSISDVSTRCGIWSNELSDVPVGNDTLILGTRVEVGDGRVDR